jgi:hypothetical protein
MVSELQATDIPVNRVDVLHILALHGDRVEDLSPEQIAAIRAIYHLDSDLTVEQLIADEENEGSILTDRMEDETEAINKHQRGDRL